jgi:TDG/mug DNA glycosylase family protein
VSWYRVAFDRPNAGVGLQPDRIAASAVRALPNPSGLSPNDQLPQLLPLFRDLRLAAFGSTVADATTSTTPAPE